MRTGIQAGSTLNTVSGSRHNDVAVLLPEDLIRAGIYALPALVTQLFVYERPHFRNHK